MTTLAELEKRVITLEAERAHARAKRMNCLDIMDSLRVGEALAKGISAERVAVLVGCSIQQVHAKIEADRQFAVERTEWQAKLAAECGGAQ